MERHLSEDCAAFAPKEMYNPDDFMKKGLTLARELLLSYGIDVLVIAGTNHEAYHEASRKEEKGSLPVISCIQGCPASVAAVLTKLVTAEKTSGMIVVKNLFSAIVGLATPEDNE